MHPKPTRFLPLAAALLLSALPVPATAHPHTWIDVSVEVVFEQGHAVGLRETWLFDDYYTAYATEGMDEDGDGQPDAAKLRALLEENMSNLAEYTYFTQVTQGGNDVAFAEVAEMSSRMVGTRLEMSFLLPLAAPLNVSGASMVYAIFDPTYYIEMLHAEARGAIRLTGAPAGCAAKLDKPKPTAEATSLAASLDRTQSAGDTLGAIFAERVTIRCP